MTKSHLFVLCISQSEFVRVEDVSRLVLGLVCRSQLTLKSLLWTFCWYLDKNNKIYDANGTGFLKKDGKKEFKKKLILVLQMHVFAVNLQHFLFFLLPGRAEEEIQWSISVVTWPAVGSPVVWDPGVPCSQPGSGQVHQAQVGCGQERC